MKAWKFIAAAPEWSIIDAIIEDGDIIIGSVRDVIGWAIDIEQENNEERGEAIVAVSHPVTILNGVEYVIDSLTVIRTPDGRILDSYGYYVYETEEEWIASLEKELAGAD